jgi:hypothetical protein
LAEEDKIAMLTASKIEIAKALRHIKAVATSEQYNSVLQTLTGGPVDAIEHAVSGLSEEDEFVLLCMLMQTSTHLAPLGQTASIAVGNAAPDLLARFQPGFWPDGIPSSRHRGYRCLVEVKSTSKGEFSMGGSALQRLRAFADAFQLPLLFAVRFLRHRRSAVWVIVEDTNRSKRSLKVLLSDWIEGLRPVLWNEYAYMIVTGTQFQITYSPEIRGEGARHPVYGEQVALRIITSKKSIDLVALESVLTSAFFETYNLIETDVQREGEFVRATYRPEADALSIADLIYRMNRLPTDDEGRRTYDAGRAIRELAEGQRTTLVNRALVDAVGKAMCDIGALCVLGYDGPEQTRRKWLATGGQQCQPSKAPGYSFSVD